MRKQLPSERWRAPEVDDNSVDERKLTWIWQWGQGWRQRGSIRKTLKRSKWPALFILCKGDGGVERRIPPLWLGDADGGWVLWMEMENTGGGTWLREASIAHTSCVPVCVVACGESLKLVGSGWGQNKSLGSDSAKAMVRCKKWMSSLESVCLWEEHSPWRRFWDQ